MNIDLLKRSIAPYYRNLFGWRTNRKIVVIESDDWGSIRMPSRAVYEKCLKAGYRVDQIAYERFDSLASENDLTNLFELLSSFKDSNGNHPVITANSLVANPDFEKIRNSNFNEYHFELLSDTFKNYPKHSNCINLWNKGIEEGIFFPQSHGREHLNVSMFMNALQKGDRDVHFGFDQKMPGCIPKSNFKRGNKYVETLRYISEQDKKEKLSIVIEGLELFEDLFGFHSASFIPPNYIWSPDYDEQMSKKGVMIYQGNRKMKELLDDGKILLNGYVLGEKNKFGQKYLVRNATFEPSLVNSTVDSVDQCLADISIAFSMKKPAIICSHRLNYVGFIDESNRDQNLKQLNKLLKSITSKWPDVEFMSSIELGNLIGEKK